MSDQLRPEDLDAFAQSYDIPGAVREMPPKPSKGNSYDFSGIVVQSPEDFARLPESQKQLLRNMKQGIQYTPEAAASFVESFNQKQLEQSTPQAQAQLQKAQLDIEKATAEAAQIQQRKQAASSEIAGMRQMLAELKGHPGMSTSVGAKGIEYNFGMAKEPYGGTKAADFYTLLEQVQGGTFMQAFDKLKGAGQITEQEGAKATAAIARLNARQSEEGFAKALMDFDGVLAQAQARSQPTAPQAAATAPQAAPQAAPAQPQQPATRVIGGRTFIQQPNGNWIPR
jgi:hypothetical protein